MLERDMESLIAAHPADFFPRHELVLEGRQKSFRGVGRFDLLFRDQFGFNVLMELKAVPARYEDASQLAKYRDAMIASGDSKILMWLVATSIPASVREFLDHVGIQYTEIHIAEFKRAAVLHGYQLQETAPSAFIHAIDPDVRRTEETTVAKLREQLSPRRPKVEASAEHLQEQQITSLRRIIRDYLERPFDKSLENYGVPARMHEHRVVPYSYLGKRLFGQRSFKKDAKGPAPAMRWALSEMDAKGLISELRPKEVSLKYKSTMRAYRVSEPSYFYGGSPGPHSPHTSDA